MTRRRPPARLCGTPLPTSPLKGGGAQTVRTGLSGIIVVGRTGGSPPFSLLPLKGGRRENGGDRARLPGDGDVGAPSQNFQMRSPCPAPPK